MSDTNIWGDRVEVNLDALLAFYSGLLAAIGGWLLANDHSIWVGCAYIVVWVGVAWVAASRPADA